VAPRAPPAPRPARTRHRASRAARAAAPATAPAAAAAPSTRDVADPLGPVHEHVEGPARVQDQRLPASADAEIGPGTRGFSLAESELGFAASIDPWWRGAANIALHPDDTVSVEEAYVQTTSLGNGLTVKAGRFFSGIGYLNPQHATPGTSVDNPLAYQAMLGTQFGDDGVQLAWLAPTDRNIELGLEVGRGRKLPGASDTSRNGAGHGRDHAPHRRRHRRQPQLARRPCRCSRRSRRPEASWPPTRAARP
jgi:hypothetical protein